MTVLRIPSLKDFAEDFLKSFIFVSNIKATQQQSNKGSFLVKNDTMEAAHQQYLGELGDLRERVTREARG